MKEHLLKIILLRILSSFLVLFFVVSFVFILIHISPGNPSHKFISPGLSPQLFEEISESYKLNEPIIEQYYAFVVNIASGDFGYSYNYREPVLTVIKNYFTFTLFFGLASFIFQIFITIMLVYMAVKINLSWFEKIMSGFNLTLYSIPIFISGIILIYIFSYKLNILPSSGIKSIQFSNQNIFQLIVDYSKHLILPILASSFAAIPIYYKYLYGSVKNISESNFVKNLEIMGINKTSILLKNIIPNSLSSLISVAGVELGVLLGGSVIIETIFSLPGMGRLTLSAVLTRDYPLVVGAVLISSSVVLLVNLVADIVRVIIDKRVIKNLLS